MAGENTEDDVVLPNEDEQEIDYFEEFNKELDKEVKTEIDDDDVEMNEPLGEVEETTEKDLKPEEKEAIAKVDEVLLDKKDEVKTPSYEEIEKNILSKIEEKNNLSKQAEIAQKEKLENEARVKQEKERLRVEEETWSPDSVLSEDEKKSLNELKEVYPEVEKAWVAQEKKLKAVFDRELKKYTTQAFEQYNSNILPILEPMYNNFVQKKKEEEDAKLYSAHPDLQEVNEGLTKWVNGIKGKLKEDYTSAFVENRVDDIIEIIDTYKKIHKIETRDPKAEKEQADKEQAEIERQNLEIKQAQETAKKEREEAKKLAEDKLNKKKQALGAVSSKVTKIDDGDKTQDDYFEHFSKILK